MEKHDLLVFGLNWLAANWAAVVSVLGALTPVLALGVAGLALYVVARLRGGGGKK